jgi:hypothetical protein
MNQIWRINVEGLGNRKICLKTDYIQDVNKQMLYL